MKSEEALELLDRTVAQMNGPRQVHLQLQKAVECLKILIFIVFKPIQKLLTRNINT